MRVEIPDEQAAVLKARAAAEGLTLEAWLERLAGVATASANRKGKYSLADLLSQCDPNAPLSDEDRAWLDAPSVGRKV